MKKTHLAAQAVLQNRKEPETPKFILFCEKKTGAAQFRAELNGGADWDAERIASTLAMQCFVRGQDPEDFMILVPAGSPFADRLVSRASELLEDGRGVRGPAFLSPRQTEILHAVMRNKANKEIADRLNITVRTVKFHISVLLNKFGVQSRLELAKRAAVLLRPAALEELSMKLDSVALESEGRTMSPVVVKKPLPLDPAARAQRMLGNVLTA